MKYVLFALLAWVLYQFIFKLVIPVYRTTRKIKKGFREMQEKMNEQYRQQQQQQGNPQDATTPRPGTSTVSKGDYIDFEEIK
jgi:hypothetical protein